MKTYTYKEIIENKMDVIFIDVRSEGEYEKEHIPGAINIPLLDNEQRKIVGTIYKTIGKRKAKEKGLEFVAPKLMDLYHNFSEVSQVNKQIVIYCARGGTRSESITSLMQSFLTVVKLEGGYKSYRDYVRTNLDILLEDFTFVTLYGPTGCGKTRLLEQFTKQGYDVLDLEACANNRGSILGGVGLSKDHSQKYFESLVFDTLINAKSKLIFCEGESKRIGSIVMLGKLYDKTRGNYKIYIDCPLDRRVQIIKEEYITDDLDLDKLKITFEKLKRYHGSDKINNYIIQLENNQSELVIENLIVDYYDKVYSSKSNDFITHFTNNNEKDCVNEIINYLEKHEIV